LFVSKVKVLGGGWRFSGDQRGREEAVESGIEERERQFGEVDA